MNFFSCQDKARKDTRFLVLAFIVAICGVVGLIDLCIYFYNQNYVLHEGFIINQELIVIINVAIGGSILVGSILKYIKFRSGGKSIAKMLNAIRIEAVKQDQKIIRLINIVAEISIASGVVAPTIYVLPEEKGINAFVAGYNPNDIILVVTQGTLDNLTREELQGVIAHEFSHIFNSDTVINLRLLIVLGGLLTLSQLGYAMMRRNNRSNRVVFIGIVIYLIGSLGLLFGNIIKATISRRRETLADASSVQYTRNPAGITTALLKIQAQGSAALMDNPQAENVNHFCFSKASDINFSSLFETHPKLETRIALLDPTGEITSNFKNKKIVPVAERISPKTDSTENNHKFILGSAIAADTILNNIGNPNLQSFDQAENLLQNIPSELHAIFSNQDAAQALIYSIAISTNETTNYSLQNLVMSQDVKNFLDRCLTIPQINIPMYRITLVSLAIPTLRTLSSEDSQTFYNNVHALLSVDNKFTLSKALLLAMLKQRLDSHSYKNITYKYNTFKSIKEHITCFLWFLAKHGTTEITKQQQAFTSALSQFTATNIAAFTQNYDFSDLIKSIDYLRFMTPTLKHKFFTACVVCITKDSVVADNEQEMLRAICICLDCPMPQIA